MSKKILAALIAGMLIFTAVPVMAAGTGDDQQEPAAEQTAEDEDKEQAQEDAEEEQGSNLADSTYGVVQVEIGYLMPDGSFDIWGSYPGFAVDKTNVITEKSNVVVIDQSSVYQKALQEKAAGYTSIGIDLTDFSKIRSDIVIRINDGSGSLLRGTMAQLDDSVPFALISTSKPVADYCAFAEEDPAYGDEAYLAGFVAEVMDGKTYSTSDDVVVHSVALTGVDTDGKLTFALTGEEAFGGGPLINTDGAVSGMAITPGTEWGGVTASYIKGVLEDSLINYTVREKAKETDFTDLSVTLDSAKEIDLSPFTEESAQALTDAIAAAEEVMKNENATQSEVDAARKDISLAVGALEEKTFSFELTPLMIGLIVGACVAIYLIIFFIRRAIKKKKSEETYGYEDPEDAIADEYVRGKKAKEPSATKAEAVKEPGPSAIKKEEPKKQEIPKGYVEEELTLEDESADPTDLLVSEPTVKACIVRRMTGERKNIDKNRFIIGKDRSRTDFTIVGNKTISRVHAEIAFSNGVYTIRDLNSLNKTYVDGEILKPDMPKPLHDHASIGLSDEGFTFIIED